VIFQETWQEVCLVVEHDEEQGKGELLVLNRPMAFKLTANLAQLVLQGSPTNKAKSCPSLEKFMKAFGQECAIYVGGPDEQYQPAAVIHGFKELPGAREVSPGSNIYMGGMEAVVQGVIDGKYKPLDFRFFIGRHRLNDNLLELECLLGKYQPVACARPLALKQCISLPKPLWHEVLELCGGELQMISQLEILKRDDLNIQFEIDNEDEDEILDELDELSSLDDDEDDDDDYSF
jgi:putative transcriptional regulator